MTKKKKKKMKKKKKEKKKKEKVRWKTQLDRTVVPRVFANGI